MSLAKFLTTSLVFRERASQAQHNSGLALCNNFGWAPQRYVSRREPLSKEVRRLDAIWNALGTEAAPSSSERTPIARFFLRELGGENSWRLVLGGILTDILEEHYLWVAGGDKTRPDPATGTDRTNLFLKRCEVLIGEGHVLTMRNTYTGEVMEFLKRTKTVVYGDRAATVGLGPLRRCGAGHCREGVAQGAGARCEYTRLYGRLSQRVLLE